MAHPRLSDADVLLKATGAADGEKFRQIWAEQWQQAGYESQSEADAALVWLLS